MTENVNFVFRARAATGSLTGVNFVARLATDFAFYNRLAFPASVPSRAFV